MLTPTSRKKKKKRAGPLPEKGAGLLRRRRLPIAPSVEKLHVPDPHPRRLPRGREMGKVPGHRRVFVGLLARDARRVARQPHSLDQTGQRRTSPWSSNPSHLLGGDGAHGARRWRHQAMRQRVWRRAIQRGVRPRAFVAVELLQLFLPRRKRRLVNFDWYVLCFI